jgi:hypothetical protein
MTQFDRHAMIIGSMKCGTSSLFRLLEQHPQICGSSPKEPEFFAPGQSHRVEKAKYADLWDFDPARHRIALEASTGYTKWPSEPGVPERIRDAGLKPRFIYIVRNPFERAQSHWDHLQLRHGFDRRRSVTDGHFVALSSYHAQLARFRSVFPERDRYLVLDFAELRDQPALCHKCFTFLGVDPHHVFEIEPRNVTRRPSAAELALRRSGAQHFARLAPRGLKNLVRKAVERRAPEPRPTLSESEFDYIRTALDSEMRLLESEYGIDVGKWGFGPQREKRLSDLASSSAQSDRS